MHSFEEFLEVIKTLRSENGCPWDREQTHSSLKQCMLEEAYEVIDGIQTYEETGDDTNLKEELGDVLLQVVMHAQIAKEENRFSFDDVVDEICEKMIRRHPHVFGDTKVSSSGQVLEQWEEIKKKEKKEEELKDSLLRVAKAYPANIRAEKVQKKAQKAGVELYVSPEQMIAEIKEKINFLEQYASVQKQGKIQDLDKINEELGKLMFTIVSFSSFLGVSAENSLTNATNQFINKCVAITYF